jgi:hypothetical protein
VTPVIVVTRLRLKDPALLDDWEQASPALPDWQTSWRHITTGGTAATLTQPSPANSTLAFPPPAEAPASGASQPTLPVRTAVPRPARTELLAPRARAGRYRKAA